MRPNDWANMNWLKLRAVCLSLDNEPMIIVFNGKNYNVCPAADEERLVKLKREVVWRTDEHADG